MDITSLSPEQQELLALLIGDVDNNPDDSIEVHGDIVEAPLSFAQQRLWFLDRMEPESSTYNIVGPCRLKGTLNVSALRRSLEEVVYRHRALRAVFRAEDGVPIQRFAPPQPWQLPVIDVTDVTPAKRLSVAQEMCAKEADEPFDLAAGPLFRTRLYKLNEDDHILLVVMHHIVSDGWSLGLLTTELSTLYEAFVNGKPSPLPKLTVQYSDYAIWQRDWLKGDSLRTQLAYWKKQLGGVLPALELPTDKLRPALQTFNGSSEPIVFSQGLREQLRLLAQREGATLFMALLAGFQVLLWRYTGQDDMLVGTPTAGRNRAETEGLVGLFLNTIVMRTDLSGDPTFRELLQRVKTVALDAYNHHDIPFEKLVEELLQTRDLSRSPLFQVMFILQVPNRPVPLQGLEFAPSALPLRQTKYELTLFLWEHADKLEGSVEYNTDLFEASTIHRMIGHLQRVLEGVAADPDQRISQVPMISESEARSIVYEWNRTDVALPVSPMLHTVLEQQVRKSPDRIAATFEGRSITFRELDERAKQLARYLRSLGVKPGVLTCVCLERSLNMLVALLGVLKAGGAYVPIDPAYPSDRIGFMLEDSGAPVLITEERMVELLPAVAKTTVRIDADWPAISHYAALELDDFADPESPAYVIFTSGSTGRPKGVLIPHRAVVNFLQSMAKRPGMLADDVLLAVTTLSFDIAGLELFLPLSTGARIEIVSRETTVDATRLRTAITRSGTTVMQATPATWRMLIDSGWRGDSRLKVLCGGEALTSDLASELLKRSREVWNLYGPTETTIWSTVEKIESGEAILIGKPIDNTRTYVLDTSLRPVPAGIAGELHIAGTGLALGYLNRPELTRERFIQDPFAGGAQRMYKTGDLARYRADGKIECLGRLDGQVKLRGYRIELEEIEVTLRRLPGVRAAAATVREDVPSDKRLVAYVIPHAGHVLVTEDLRRGLREILPDYMIPSVFAVLKELPLTPNGKVDRRSLPVPDSSSASRGNAAFAPPDSDSERIICEIWEEVLGITDVGRYSNFFDLGGHSLLLAIVHSRLQSRIGFELPMTSLFRFPTVSALAEQLNQNIPEMAGAREGQRREARRRRYAAGSA